MARIPTYEIDQVFDDNDLLLGTDGATSALTTKNFSLAGLAEYVIDKLIDPDATSFCIPVFRDPADTQGANATRITSSIIQQNIYPNGSNISISGTLDVEKKVIIKGNINGSGSLQLNCEQNSHGVTIQGPPHSAQALYTMILPSSMGNVGQQLTTDGISQLSWTDPEDDNLNIAADTNSGSIDLDTQALTISGGTLISTTVDPNGGQNIIVGHDSISRTDNGNQISLNFGDTFDAETSIQTDQGGHVELVNTTTYTLPTPPITDAYPDTNKIPVWVSNTKLGSMIGKHTGPALGDGGIYGGIKPSINVSGAGHRFVGSIEFNMYDGGLNNTADYEFNQQGLATIPKIKSNNMVLGTTAFPTPGSQAALDVSENYSGGRAAIFRGGVVLSNNPSGVAVDNTSMVIGAGNNDIISGCDNSFAVGNGNQIQLNSDNSVSIGTSNTLRGAKNSLAVGLGNSITLSSPGHSIVQGQNNTLTNSFSSFVAGGNNTVNVNQNAFVLGYSHALTGADSFVVLGENNTSQGSVNDNNVYMIGGNLHGKDGTMVLGFRNEEASYPATDYANGLGNTKFVVGVGTVDDTNAMIITEGGVTRGGSGVSQVPRIVLPSVVGFNFTDDVDAAANGIPVGGLYHTAGLIKIRRS